MKNKNCRNTLILFLITWAVLAAVLVFVIEIPFSLLFSLKVMIACGMIAMSYYYVANRK